VPDAKGYIKLNDLGQILHIDLAEKKTFVEPFTSDVFDSFIGGRGFNVWYLYNHLPVNTDPLSPENILILSCGFLTGSSAPTASRLHFNALSPLTGILGSSNVGGYAGAWLRSCGLYSVAIKSKASHPVYLYISENNIEIMDARSLWGLDTLATQVNIKKHLHDTRVKILAIGPGGENGARFACIMTDKDHAAGRTGMGAVMGAKNLKAIVIARGSQKPFQVGSPAARDAVKRYVIKIKDSAEYKLFSEYGSAGYVKWAHEMGIMGAKNYRQTKFTPIDQVDGKRLKKNVIRSSGCFRCPVQCKADLWFRKGESGEWTATRPEFEPMINLGAKCGVSDLETIVRLDNLCSRLGLDSTSTASVIAFGMDLYEREILTRQDTGGLDLSWGNGEAMEVLIRQMVTCEGFGKILAQGVRRAAAIIGKGADNYAAHVKGLELTAYHPGAILGTALGYAVSSRGGDYNNVYACIEYGWSKDKATKEFGTPEAVNIKKVGGKGRLVRRSVLVNIVLDCLGLCKVPALSLLGAFDLKDEAELAATLTQRRVSAKDLFKAGERIAALERLFNLRHSTVNSVDGLPSMFLKKKNQPLTPESLSRMIGEFYEAMAWDETGRPMDKKLKELGITL
jgi:aldehyde:ferredoxin oxidoreductase